MQKTDAWIQEAIKNTPNNSFPSPKKAFEIFQDKKESEGQENGKN